MAFALFVIVAGTFVHRLARHKAEQSETRRIERKERVAAYELSRLRKEREWDAALRYHGGVVR